MGSARNRENVWTYTPPIGFTPEFLEANPLTLEQMTADGVAVSEYLLKHLRKQKLIPFGTSWGSALGVKIVSRRPDLFLCLCRSFANCKPTIDEAFYNKIYKIAKEKMILNPWKY